MRNVVVVAVVRRSESGSVWTGPYYHRNRNHYHRQEQDVTTIYLRHTYMHASMFGEVSSSGALKKGWHAAAWWPCTCLYLVCDVCMYVMYVHTYVWHTGRSAKLAS